MKDLLIHVFVNVSIYIMLRTTIIKVDDDGDGLCLLEHERCHGKQYKK